MSQIQNAMIEASKAIKKAFVDVRAKNCVITPRPMA